MQEKTEAMELTEEERKLIEHARKVDYGKVVVTIKGGVPCHMEIQRSIQLK